MLAKKTSKNQITLPKAITRRLPDADCFDVSIREGEVILRPVAVSALGERLKAVRAKIKAPRAHRTDRRGSDSLGPAPAALNARRPLVALTDYRPGLENDPRGISPRARPCEVPSEQRGDQRADGRELLPFVETVRVRRRLSVVHRDPDDDKFLECTVAGGAEFLVTGDRDLLDLRSYRRVQILTIRDFLEKAER